jgi:pimeloyl-ACP methyl ester carboxylesterase
MPPIRVPAVVLEGGSDGVLGPSAACDRGKFTGHYEYVRLPGIGHNVPQVAPREFAAAVLRLRQLTPGP